MRKAISDLLIRLANKINPKEKQEQIDSVCGYEAKKFGISLVYGKNEINDFKKKARLKHRVSRIVVNKMLVEEVKSKVTNIILDSIVKKRLIEFSVKKFNDEITVEGHIKIYVKK